MKMTVDDFVRGGFFYCKANEKTGSSYLILIIVLLSCITLVGNRKLCTKKIVFKKFMKFAHFIVYLLSKVIK